MNTPLEDYALIGDCETAALVSRAGSIEALLAAVRLGAYGTTGSAGSTKRQVDFQTSHEIWMTQRRGTRLLMGRRGRERL